MASSRWWLSSSAPSRVLPMPGSPTMRTQRNSPAALRRNSSSRIDISWSRPTRRGPRTARASGRALRRRVAVGPGSARHSTVAAETGSGRPFSRRRPADRNEKPPREPTSSRTRSLARICPPSAVSQSRLAMTTAVPWKSSSAWTGSPAWRPIRTRRGNSGLRPLCSSVACWMATADRIAWSELVKATMSPSPRVLTSWPPPVLMALRSRPK